MHAVLGEWSFGPTTWVVVAIAGWVGAGTLLLRAGSPPPRRCQLRNRMLTALAAAAVVVVAVDSPVAYFGSTWYWMRMVQESLLMVVAPPIIVASAPWTPMRRVLRDQPLPAAGAVARAGRWVNRPWVAMVAFVVDIWAWHQPAFTAAAVASPALHALQLCLALGLGVFFWLQVIDSEPVRSQLSFLHRIFYLVAFAMQNWILALGLVFASGPWYRAFSHPGVSSGALSGLADQQVGGGVLWIPAMIPVAFVVAGLAVRFVSNRSQDLDTELGRMIDAETRAGRLPAPRRWRVSLAPRHHLD